MPLICIVTCSALPELDKDEDLLRFELIDRGVEVRPAVWSDPEVDWSLFDAAIIRCTWDYSERGDEFVAWARRAGAATRLLNPAPIVAWNTDKHYLADLAAAGIPVVPTTFVEPGEAWSFEGLGEFVVKPTVSCGSRDTMRYALPGSGSTPDAHVRRLLDEGRSVMLQPYLEAVDTVGESALIFIDGTYSHSIRKGQMLHRDRSGAKVVGLYVEEQIDPRTATEAELAVAERVLDAIPGGREQILYARVDLIPDAQGAPTLLELELTEPSLFYRYAPDVVSRLATGLLNRL